MPINEAKQAMREGRLEDAAVLLRNALSGRTGHPELHYNLAMVLIRLGRFGEAVDHFEICSKAAPDNPEILNNLANAQRLSGQQDRSRRNFDRVLELSPGHPGALCNRGWLQLGASDPVSALRDFREALQRDTGLSEAWRGLGECELTRGNWEAGQQALERSLALRPDSADTLNSLGVASVKQSQLARAADFFERALKLQPGHVDALTNHGITCEQLGRLDDAERSLQQAVSRRPGFAPAHFHLAQLAKHEPSVSERHAIEVALAGNPPPAACIDLEFALGKTLAKLGDHDEAFAHFAAARTLLADSQPFDLAAEVKGMSRILEMHPHVSPPGETVDMIFVVGMPRSGTTLADQILASHSQTIAIGESGRVGHVLSRITRATGNSYPDAYRGLDSRLVSELSTELLSRPQDGGSSAVLLDTTPSNFLYLGLLADLLPGCRFVHCRRNPLDTCLSIFEHPLTRSHAYANRLESLAEYYIAYRDMMQTWQERLGARIHNLDYESLVEAPEEEIRKLLAHCSLPFETACLEFHRTERAVLTPSASQVRQPISTASVGRWRNYEKFLGPLLERLC